MKIFAINVKVTGKTDKVCPGKIYGKNNPHGLCSSCHVSCTEKDHQMCNLANLSC